MKWLLIFGISLSLLSCSDPAAQDSQTLTATQSKAVEYKPKPLKPEEIVSPTQSIKDLDQMIEEYHLGKSLTAEQMQSNRLLKQKIIRGTFDIRELCRLSLSKHWKTITSPQQDLFVSLMTQLLETKALFSKEQLRGENKLYSIRYQKEVYDDDKKQRSTVKTQMVIPKDKVTLDITYKMLISPYGWKIYDVIVDEASLLANYKFQFDRIIQKSGFDDLIARMKTKLEGIEKES